MTLLRHPVYAFIAAIIVWAGVKVHDAHIKREQLEILRVELQEKSAHLVRREAARVAPVVTGMVASNWRFDEQGAYASIYGEKVTFDGRSCKPVLVTYSTQTGGQTGTVVFVESDESVEDGDLRNRPPGKQSFKTWFFAGASRGDYLNAEAHHICDWSGEKGMEVKTQIGPFLIGDL